MQADRPGEVGFESAGGRGATLGWPIGGPGERVCVRSRRFVLDAKPVLLSTSFLPASIVAGSAIAQEDAGPGGTYAASPSSGVHPPTSARTSAARMPQPEETEALDLPSTGTSVVDIVRTAFTDAGRPVEVNAMALDASAHILHYDSSASPLSQQDPRPPGRVCARDQGRAGAASSASDPQG